MGFALRRQSTPFTSQHRQVTIQQLGRIHSLPLAAIWYLRFARLRLFPGPPLLARTCD